MSNTLQELATKAFPISEAPDIFETTSQLDKREGFLVGAEHSGLAGLVEALEKIKLGPLPGDKNEFSDHAVKLATDALAKVGDEKK